MYLYFPKVHYLIAIKNKMKSMDLGFIFLIQQSVYLRGTGSAAPSAKQRAGWPIEQSSPTCHEVNTCRSQAAARTPRELQKQAYGQRKMKKLKKMRQRLEDGAIVLL